jgi:hypothetical protein
MRRALPFVQERQAAFLPVQGQKQFLEPGVEQALF